MWSWSEKWWFLQLPFLSTISIPRTLRQNIRVVQISPQRQERALADSMALTKSEWRGYTMAWGIQWWSYITYEIQEDNICNSTMATILQKCSSFIWTYYGDCMEALRYSWAVFKLYPVTIYCIQIPCTLYYQEPGQRIWMDKMIQGSTYICSNVDVEPVHPVVGKIFVPLLGLPSVGISNPREIPLYLNWLG